MSYLDIAPLDCFIVTDSDHGKFNTMAKYCDLPDRSDNPLRIKTYEMTCGRLTVVVLVLLPVIS